MNKLALWGFYVLLAIYAVYNVLWLVGVTFSWGKNDKTSELVYLLLTFIADIPIFCYMVKHLKIGLILFASVLMTSFLFGRSWLSIDIKWLSMWYAPKVFMLATAIWVNHLIRKQNHHSAISP